MKGAVGGTRGREGGNEHKRAQNVLRVRGSESCAGRLQEREGKLGRRRRR